MTGGFSSVLDQPRRSSQKFKGTARVLGPRWIQLPILTIGLLGVQIFWSVEMGYASPYLLSMGLSKSSMAIVFLAGPLSGLIMQPVIGVLADNSTSRFGRRRPYMLCGIAVCVLAMLLLGYTRSVAALFTGWDNERNDSLTITLAVLSIFLIDFSINAVQALDRALLVDTLLPADQAAGNAWAARMLGFGAVLGFFVGTIPLPSLFPFLGETQLQVLSVIVSVLLLSSHFLMAVCVKERVLIKSADTGEQSKISRRPLGSLTREARDLWTNLVTLRSDIKQICIIQFFAWIAWFPLLFYTTIYIGDLYKRATPVVPSSSTTDVLHFDTITSRARDAEATRLGSRALFYSALLALLINFVAPIFVAPAVTRSRGSGPAYPSSGSAGGSETLESARVGVSNEGRIQQNMAHDEVRGLRRWLRVPGRMKVNLASLWAVSHLMLAGCMLGTLFTESVTGATVLISLTGFSWAITQWAPFSLLAEAILTEPNPSIPSGGSIRLADTRTFSRNHEGEEVEREGEGERDAFLPEEHVGFDHDTANIDEEMNTSSGSSESTSEVMGNLDARTSRIHIAGEGDLNEWEDDNWQGGDPDEEGGGERRSPQLSAKAGIILGIHNMFIVVPQFLVTGLSAVIFAAFDPVQTRSGGGVLVPPPTSNGNATVVTREGMANLVHRLSEEARGVRLLTRDFVDQLERDKRGGQSNSVVYIFRLGGVAALIAFILSWRLARESRHR